MTRAQLINLFDRYKAGDAAAADELADVLGAACELSHIGSGWWFGLDARRNELWTFWGRHAPLKSLDCAMMVPKLDGWVIEVREYHPNLVGSGYVLPICVVGDDGAGQSFDFGNRAHLPAAIGCARHWGTLDN